MVDPKVPPVFCLHVRAKQASRVIALKEFSILVTSSFKPSINIFPESVADQALGSNRGHEHQLYQVVWMFYGQRHANPAIHAVTREVELIVTQLVHQFNGIKRILFQVVPVFGVLTVTAPATFYDDHSVMLF
jgi:hypothetical protein